MENAVYLAVNGTLMRGLALNGNMQQVGAVFVRESLTEPTYRLWSIGDRHPAMIRVASEGAAIAVEIWAVQIEGIATLLQLEPPGLCIGKVRLADGEEVLGVLGEPIICDGQREITAWGGWRAYWDSRSRRDEENRQSTFIVKEGLMPEAQFDSATYVEQAAQMIGLPLPPEHLPSVIANFDRIAAVAQQVMEVPLPEEIEIAPVFEP
ncbi:AtzG-like protein [Pantanalinema sp. GBBB05]|uniref:DUF4089 domain-containing protein n=1 Tax=Pantanalinema sp. GBBB05 TaxID=2604139 RepID=UPI001D47BEAB|nr:DUF4089 domain-containing protein [Pantanalinema sp. GBBB05]